MTNQRPLNQLKRSMKDGETKVSRNSLLQSKFPNKYFDQKRTVHNELNSIVDVENIVDILSTKFQQRLIDIVVVLVDKFHYKNH